MSPTSLHSQPPSAQKILGVIPARGGSKGVPRKNIRPLAGHPLIAYTIVPSRASRWLTDLVVSTEDAEIADIARHYGAQVPFMRPAELATDLALAVPTMQQALTQMEEIRGHRYDYLVMLQPTCPFTTTADIDGALELLVTSGADSVISVADVGGNHPARMKVIRDGLLLDYAAESTENMPRQKLPPVYIRSGDLYAVKRDVLMQQGTFKGDVSRPWVIPPERHVNIDELADWLLAEHRIATAGNPLAEWRAGARG